MKHLFAALVAVFFIACTMKEPVQPPPYCKTVADEFRNEQLTDGHLWQGVLQPAPFITSVLATTVDGSVGYYLIFVPEVLGSLDEDESIRFVANCVDDDGSYRVYEGETEIEIRRPQSY